MRSTIMLSLLGLSFFFYACNGADKKQNETAVMKATKHTPEFNNHISNALKAYDKLTEDFVNWDSVAAKTDAANLKTLLDSLQKISVDSSGKTAGVEKIESAGKYIDTIVTGKNILDQKHAFNNLTETMYGYLDAVQYDRAVVYLQKCPMAFNDIEPGVWLSKTDSIRNPYMGLHHPRYGKGMIECGENKATLNYTATK